MSLNVRPNILRDADIDSMPDEVANYLEEQIRAGRNELLDMADQLHRKASLLKAYADAKFVRDYGDDVPF